MIAAKQLVKEKVAFVCWHAKQVAVTNYKKICALFVIVQVGFVSNQKYMCTPLQIFKDERESIIATRT